MLIAALWLASLLPATGGPRSAYAPGIAWRSVVEVRCDGARRDTRAMGFFVAPDRVATVLHAVTGDDPADVPRSIRVVTAEGRVFPVVELSALDAAEDLAVLRLPGGAGAPVRLRAEPVRSGEVLRIPANPWRLDRPTLQVEVEAVRWGEDGTERLRVAGTLHRRSGAPAFDADGAVVGLVTTTHELVPVAALRRRLDDGARVSPREAHRALGDTPYGMLDYAYRAWQRGDLAAAEEWLQRAAARTPRLAAVHNMLGVLHRRQGRFDEAERAYRTALTLRSGFGAAYRNLGLLLDERAVRGPVAGESRQGTRGASGPGGGPVGVETDEGRHEEEDRAPGSRVESFVVGEAPWSPLWRVATVLLLAVPPLFLAGALLADRRRRRGAADA